ncbi:MAG: 16S rRNA (uracil(1498)-N(3))-methyltransferase [Oxalobacter sp.]|nr:MAG: 16S rRNA (uracil(1498)-N(3))-methyltransferase [Oxalobacter sp.]
MPRLYCPITLSPGARVVLPEAAAHHVQVLRLKEGDSITLFNGQGGEYEARLSGIEKKRVSAVIISHSLREAELAYAVTLAQALPESAKMDWIVEKAVELGAAALQPLATQRAVVKLSGERMEKRLAHWEAIVAAASEQCGRNRLMQIAPVMEVSRWVAAPADQPRILFSPRATQSFAEWARAQTPQAVTLIIGPEGGLSKEEESFAEAKGAILLSLGDRVLRTETAGVAALAMLSGLWDQTGAVKATI